MWQLLLASAVCLASAQMPAAPMGAIDDSEDVDDMAPPASDGMAEPNMGQAMPRAQAPTSTASMNAPKKNTLPPNFSNAVHLVASASAAHQQPGFPEDNAPRTRPSQPKFEKEFFDPATAVQGGGELRAPTADAPQAVSTIPAALAAGNQQLVGGSIPGAGPSEQVKMYNSDLYKIHVRVPNWDDLMIYVEKGYSARTVKSILEAKWGIRNTKLWFNRKEIPDDEKLVDKGVKEGSIVNVVVRCSKEALRKAPSEFKVVH